ncbi:MAG: alpha-hydroxy-acid oxidizing protein, partial [Pseudomonadota bacterium]
VIVSNHGGRQLDGAPSTISVLPEIATAVGGSIEVLLDGGIRRGGDIVKALALGASGVLLGRAYAYGLAAAGGAGVQRIIEILATEVDITLALMGIASVDELKARGPAALRQRQVPPARR